MARRVAGTPAPTDGSYSFSSGFTNNENSAGSGILGTGASLASADFSGAALDDSDLSHADLKNVVWQHIKSIKGANIAAVRDAPEGFVVWAMSNGAVDHPDGDK